MILPLLTLLSDFGSRDHYVGVTKGVIAGIAPQARIIDITHEVEPFQIAQGAYLLSQAWPWFPTGTVHVAVVDPGVGSTRRAIAAKAQGHLFVLPDNGLLSLSGVQQPEVREIRDESMFLYPVSRTFQGRDIFAPVAAHLASGKAFEDVGPIIENWVRLETPGAQVLHIDRFGNVITSLRAPAALQIRGTRVDLHVESYSSAPKYQLFLITGSGGYIEISKREASAASTLGCKVGDALTVADKS